MNYRANSAAAQHVHPEAFALSYAVAAEVAASLKAGAVSAFRIATTALRHEPAARRPAGARENEAARARVSDAAAPESRAASWNPWEVRTPRAANDVRELPPNELEASAALRDAIEAHGTRSTAADGARRHLEMVRRFNEVYAWRIQ